MKKYNCEINKFASPECRLTLVNSNSVYIPERDVLVCVNYSTGTNTRIYIADLKKCSARAVQMPEDEHGVYGMEKGNDGKIYLGSFTGKVHSYDIDKGKFQLVCRMFDNTVSGIQRLTWGSGVSRRYDKIYMGVYPTGEFYEYDPKTGTCETFKPVNSQNACYARYFKELHDGRMLIMITGAVHAWAIYNPKNKELKTFTIPDGKEQYGRPMGRNVILYDKERIVYISKSAICLFNCKTGKFEDDFIKTPEPFYFIFEFKKKLYGMTSDGKIYSFDRKKITPAMDGFPEGNVPMNVHSVSNDTLLAAGDNGLVMEFDFQSGIKKSFMVPNKSTKGLALHSLKKHPSKKIAVGSQFINTQIFKLDLNTGESVSSLHKIYTKCGQINCSEVVGNKYYMGIYGGAFIAEYDPEKDFVYAENPKVVAHVGHEQNRPVSMAEHNGLIYMISKAEYCVLGGAISVFDPKTYKVDVYRNFIKDQNPNSMFKMGTSLIGTTAIYADMGTRPGKAKEAVVYVWDMNTRKVIHTSTPEPGSTGFSGIAMSSEGKMLGICGKGIFIFDAVKMSYQYLDIKLFPSKGIFVDNTIFMGALSDKIFLLDINTGEVQYIADFKKAGIFEKVSEYEFLFDHEGEIFKLKLF